MSKSLFITYDGLTDPLGQSQILPYVAGLSDLGYKLTILSCEKESRFREKKELIDQICATHEIEWVPLVFHTSPPILAKYYDLFNLTSTAKKLHKKNHFDIIHCRSYLAAEIGMGLKKLFGCKYLFDMRGFWVDERVDGGLWDKKLFFYRWAYNAYKNKEAKLISTADHIISLTEAAKKEIQSWDAYRSETPITVIPCSADLNLFSLSDAVQQLEARKELAIERNDFVLSYLGSLGTWYLLDEMLLLFKQIKSRFGEAKFLILTPDSPELIYQRAAVMGLSAKDFIIKFAERKEVSRLIKASDLSVSFIKPAYSKIASSPTKLGELLAMGIPVICNSIGDVEMIIEKSEGGIITNDFSEASLARTVSMVGDVLQKEKKLIRENVREYYSLEKAINTYGDVYKQLLKNN